MVKEIDALTALQEFRDGFETLSDCASALAISKQYLSDLLHARRDPSPRILAKLGLKRAVITSRKSQGTV